VAEVYFYVPAEKAGNAADCGIKLSEWYNREVYIEGSIKKCMAALLNPRDEYDKFRSDKYRCLRIDIQPKYCYVADRFLYEAGKSSQKARELYERSVTPIENYVLGEYRFPEALVTSTVLGEHVSILGKKLDTPLLYGNSQELYFSGLTTRLREENDELDDIFLYLYFKWLSDHGKAEVIEDMAGGIAVFLLKEDNKPYTFRVPGRIL